MSLDILGVLYGTDKSLLVQNYLKWYEEFLEPLRDKPINIIEIGVQDGASLRMWQAYFSAATIVGVDVAPICKQHEGGRIKIETGSQADAEFLSAVADRYPPTLVIDDGSHRADHQITSFEVLFPFLQAGGVYCVEDLNGDTSDGTLGVSTITAPSYFSLIQQALIARTRSALPPGCLPFFESIGRIDGISGVVAVHKRDKILNAKEDLAVLEDLTARSGVPQAWHSYSCYLENHFNDLEGALIAARRGLSQQPTNPWFHARIASIHEKMGNFEEARLEIRHALDLNSEVPHFREISERIATHLSQSELGA